MPVSPVCSQHSVEDEFHTVFECDAYYIRSTYIYAVRAAVQVWFQQALRTSDLSARWWCVSTTVGWS